MKNKNGVIEVSGGRGLSIEAKKDQVMSILGVLRKATKGMPSPASVTIVEKYGKKPFLILIGCLLSLRAKDTASLPAAERLFKLAMTPKQLLKIPLAELEKQIYSVGFYRHKAKLVKAVSADLVNRFEGKVPSTYQELLSIKGVGPKTANLVLSEAFDHQALYVDIHVHRISNRLGLIKTTKVEATQAELERIVPKRYWSEWSRLLVTWGQNICVPVSPFCSRCPVYDYCKRVGVKRQR